MQTSKNSLTARQTQVARLLLASKTTAEMSQLLGIAEGTISAHLSHVYSLYGVSNRYGFLSLVYSNPELRRSLIGEHTALTTTPSPDALQALDEVSILPERNAPDLTLKLGALAPYAYPLCIELVNASFDRSMQPLLREGPTVWAAFLQGDLRFVIDRINGLATRYAPLTTEPRGDAAGVQGNQIESARITSWLYCIRAASVALCGTEREQLSALDSAEAACNHVASSQLLPRTMRVTRIFTYACSTKSPSGLDRLLQLATETDSLSPLRLYLHTLAARLAHDIGTSQIEKQQLAKRLLIAEAEATREEIQRRSSATVFNVRVQPDSRWSGPRWNKMPDGRFAHQCLLDDPQLDIWLLLEWQILRETKKYEAVIAEFPQYREQIRHAHIKLREQRTAQLARDELGATA